MATAEIQELLALINQATNDACKVYNDARVAIPSITTPTNTPADLTAHTLALKQAIRLLEGACDQLCRTLAPPIHTVNYRTLAMVAESTIVGIVNDYKIADLLQKYPEGLDVSEIRKQTGVLIDDDRLARIMRLLATRHVFVEVSENVFANNRLSLTLLSNSATSALIGATCDEARKSLDVLPEMWKDPEWAPSQDAKKSAFSYAVRDKFQDISIFDYYRAHPQIAQRFAHGMVSYNEAGGSLACLEVYPWSKLAKDTTVCDVGGGLGAFSIPLSKAYPHLKITVQDMEVTINQAKAIWEKENPTFVKENRVTLLPYDFFAGPPVANQDFYYLRYILHDWSDEQCNVILGNVRKAMGPHSRLLIDDRLLQAATPQSTGVEFAGLADRQAPPPLLSNYGSGGLSAYSQDMFMLGGLNGKERTLSMLRSITEPHGLEVVKIYDMAEQAVVEFKIKQ